MSEKKCYICGRKATRKTKYFVDIPANFPDEKSVCLCKKHYEYVTLIKISKGDRYISEEELNYLKEELD